MAYQETLEHIISLEDEVFIDTDASMHKVTQENWEFQEALLSWDVRHIVDEAADAVTNTLIATHRVIWEVPKEKDLLRSEDIVNLTIPHYKWNDALQTYRGIYSRNTKSITKEEILDRTAVYVSWVISQASTFDKNVTLDSLINHSLGKITWRMDMYKPRIDIKKYLSEHDFKWVNYKHIWPLLANPKAREYIEKQFAYRAKDADVIMGLDARGFLFTWVADRLWIPFIMARKPNKLPWELYTTSYEKEYGTDSMSIEKNSIQKWQKVMLVDDLCATAWTALAWEELIKKAWGIVEWSCFVVWLDYLKWSEKLSWKVNSIVHY